jgi:hypothetical protein
MMLAIFSCKKDEEEPIITVNTLHYDGPNFSAPVLSRGISYPSVRFSANVIQSVHLQGKIINKIDFYLDQRPESMRLLIFQWNSADTMPGDLIYGETLSNLETNSWNSYHPDTDVSLPESGIWIAFEVMAGDNDLRVIGCDPGPRVENGDVYGLFGDNNPGWISFFEFSQQEVNINWNIRIEVK